MYKRQLTRLQRDLEFAPVAALAEATTALITQTRALDPRALALGERSRLDDALVTLEKRLRTLSHQIDTAHFTHPVRPHFVVAPL